MKVVFFFRFRCNCDIVKPCDNYGISDSVSISKFLKLSDHHGLSTKDTTNQNIFFKTPEAV